jgi:hypothetical protein
MYVGRHALLHRVFRGPLFGADETKGGTITPKAFLRPGGGAALYVCVRGHSHVPRSAVSKSTLLPDKARNDQSALTSGFAVNPTRGTETKTQEFC